MKIGEPIDLKLSKRYYELIRQFAIKDIFDALVELITNSDDSYHRLYKNKKIMNDGGPILIEVCQRRGKPSMLVVRDKAEGMTLDDMKNKLAEVGVRRSEEGDRGFMSRGAKDCTELGDVTFESIVDDKYFKAKLTTRSQFIPMVDKRKVTEQIRKSLHIERGNGTTVTIEVERHSLPRIEKILRDLPWHFALRDILDENSPCQVLIKDLNSKKKSQKITFLKPRADKIIDEVYDIPGYPNASAKFTVWKSDLLLEDPSERFRRSGFIIKGERAIHECSMLQPSFERDPNSKYYYGRIECRYIDNLMNGNF